MRYIYWIVFYPWLNNLIAQSTWTASEMPLDLEISSERASEPYNRTFLSEIMNSLAEISNEYGMGKYLPAILVMAFLVAILRTLMTILGILNSVRRLLEPIAVLTFRLLYWGTCIFAIHIISDFLMESFTKDKIARSFQKPQSLPCGGHLSECAIWNWPGNASGHGTGSSYSFV